MYKKNLLRNIEGKRNKMGQTTSYEDNSLRKHHSTHSIYMSPIQRRFSTLTRRKSFKSFDLRPEDRSCCATDSRGMKPGASNQSDSASNAPTLQLVEEALDINTASEEQLMTLPGVNRNIAKSIVLHRRSVGEFRNVEDLVNVPGMRAKIVKNIRREICTNSLKTSTSGSVDSLIAPAESPRLSNTATCACALKRALNNLKEQ